MAKGAEFWMVHVAAAQLESISAAEYARRNGISIAALHYWQHKLKPTRHDPAAGHTRKFVALQVAEPASGLRASPCILALPSGLQLSMPTLPDPDWLAALVRAVPGVR